MQHPEVVELNVGGVTFSTTAQTLTKHKDSIFAKCFAADAAAAAAASTTAPAPLLKDAAGRYFIDRDGELFKYVLDFLRTDRLTLPAGFTDFTRLREESIFYQLPSLQNAIAAVLSGAAANSASAILLAERKSSYIPFIRTNATTITVGYRGTFQSGKDGLTDVKFRKLSRILVAGKLTACRDVFGDTLNESRDADIGDLESRYSSRLFLKHTSLEQAFDMLYDAGFRLVASCGTSPCGNSTNEQLKTSGDSEENRWQHFNEFVFVRHSEIK